MLTNNKLSGKVAIITGAISGIGKAVAIDRAKAGVKIVATARRVDRLEKLKNQTQSLQSFGRCDILLHALGYMKGLIDGIQVENIS